MPSRLSTLALVNPKRKGPSNSRVDYRWRVDRERGFEKTSMIYDVDGKLVGIDYESAHAPLRETALRDAGTPEPRS